MEEAEDVERDGQLEAQRSSDGPVMTIVDGPPTQPAYPAAVPPQREVLREVETPQVKPAPQYIPLQERELSADRATQSAAQQRIQERLAKGKRFEFRTKESENEAENTDAHEQGRARVARKPLVLRSKTELENTQWADPSA